MVAVTPPVHLLVVAVVVGLRWASWTLFLGNCSQLLLVARLLELPRLEHCCLQLEVLRHQAGRVALVALELRHRHFVGRLLRQVVLVALQQRRVGLAAVAVAHLTATVVLVAQQTHRVQTQAAAADLAALEVMRSLVLAILALAAAVCLLEHPLSQPHVEAAAAAVFRLVDQVRQQLLAVMVALVLRLVVLARQRRCYRQMAQQSDLMDY